ncbi:MAG: pyruvate, phosphate dikinase, partial [Rhodovulum sp.]
MQKHADIIEFTEITPSANIAVNRHGARAKCLQRLVRMDLPLPRTVALSFDAVHRIAQGRSPDIAALMACFGAAPLVSVRPSSGDFEWGGPASILNIGMNDARHAALCESHGETAATALYLRFIQAFAVHVARLDPDMFEAEEPSAAALRAALDAYSEETDEAFPQDPGRQLLEVLRSMARAWEGTTARLLRQAKGAPADAGLGLVVQAMALGLGPEESGSGVIQFVDGSTGQRRLKGRYLAQSQGRDAIAVREGALFLTRDPRGAALEDRCPDVVAQLRRYGETCRLNLREEMQIDFTIEAGKLWVLD